MLNILLRGLFLSMMDTTEDKQISVNLVFADKIHSGSLLSLLLGLLQTVAYNKNHKISFLVVIYKINKYFNVIQSVRQHSKLNAAFKADKSPVGKLVT